MPQFKDILMEDTDNIQDKPFKLQYNMFNILKYYPQSLKLYNNPKLLYNNQSHKSHNPKAHNLFQQYKSKALNHLKKEKAESNTSLTKKLWWNMKQFKGIKKIDFF